MSSKIELFKLFDIIFFSKLDYHQEGENETENLWRLKIEKDRDGGARHEIVRNN